MHNFLIFYAPLIIVVIAIAASFFVANKSNMYEEE